MGVTCPSSHIGALVARHGFAQLDPADLHPATGGFGLDEVADFSASWDRLPPDRYASCGRMRRYGSFRFEHGLLSPLARAPFVQTSDHNRLYGDVERWFEPLEEPPASSAVLAWLVARSADSLPRLALDATSFDCGIHQIRVTAGPALDGLPTPEGVHRDGHAYVAQILVGLTSVTGGESTLWRGSLPVHRVRLDRPFGALVVDDTRLEHEVSAVRPSGAPVGHRDMLLIDFPETTRTSPRQLHEIGAEQ